MIDFVRLARDSGLSVNSNNVKAIKKFGKQVEQQTREDDALTIETAGVNGLGTLAAAALVRKKGQR